MVSAISESIKEALMDRNSLKTPAIQTAGPLTLNCEPLKRPTKMPPIIPTNTPENVSAPLANAKPKHNGSAKRKTMTEAGMSFFSFSVKEN